MQGTQCECEKERARLWIHGLCQIVKVFEFMSADGRCEWVCIIVLVSMYASGCEPLLGDSSCCC